MKYVIKYCPTEHYLIEVEADSVNDALSKVDDVYESMTEDDKMACHFDSTAEVCLYSQVKTD